MGIVGKKDAAKRPYTAATLRQLDAREVVRKLVAVLDGPLGETHEQRIQNAATAINIVLARLTVEERIETIQRVVVAQKSFTV